MEKHHLDPVTQVGSLFQEAELKERCRSTRMVQESDSGYSDVASECQSSVEQTDCEDRAHSGRWNVVISSGQPDSHPPPVALTNVLVDQESSPDSNIHSWTIHPSFQLLPSAPQILLFPSAVSTSKTETTCKKGAKYLPILNSYTKIAPYPCDLKTDSSLPLRSKKGSHRLHHGQVKRPHSRINVPNRKEIPVLLSSETKESECNLQRFVIVSSDQIEEEEQTCTVPTTDSGTQGDSGGKLSSQEVPQNRPHIESTIPEKKTNKSQRFENTWEILNRSGLLGIAMKTKELVRLNQITENQLKRLKEQVQLYTKAMNGNDSQDWQKLEDSMASDE
ncbi:CLOCK-interacting pacemaker [Pelobates fuscus]|uniref:CLOCK-interacting pacemaker n=1 Tax=Pelobates fuscus TaxID=191477 RepID=UPI002FE48B49